MGKFSGHPRIEWLSEDEIILIQTFSYEYIKGKISRLIIVPAGTRSDGASIPRWAWSIVGHPFGDYLPAAIIHDYLYRKAIGTKKDADKIFLAGMKDAKVPLWKRQIMYYAVRVGGKGNW